MITFKYSPFLKLIIRISIFIIILILLDTVTGVVFGNLLNKVKDGRYFKIAYSLNKCNEEVIIIGSSRAETNYNPAIIRKELGMTCWNAGRGGQGLIYILSIEQSLLKRYTPKMIIFNIDPTLLEGGLDYDKSSILRPFAKSNELVFNNLCKKDWSEKYKLYSNIYALNSAMFYFLRPFVLKNKDGNSADNGWKPLEGQLSPSVNINTKQVKNSLQTGTLNPEKVLLLNKMIALAQDKNTKIVFVFSPDFNPALFASSTLNYIKKIGFEKNIVVLDFSAEMKIIGHHEYYKDVDHLNYRGANEFTTLLTNQMLYNSVIQKKH